jgi:glutathione peroxidase
MIHAALIASLACSAAVGTSAESIYEFSLKSIEGKETPLAKYRGKVLLVVNVASKCGMTPQYEGLEKLYRAKKDQGFLILGFPANEFNGQEPGTDAEIQAFCTSKYDVTFPMFSKIVVKGEGIHPLYKWLTAQTGGKEIEWNFAKFLIGRDGRILKRFDPRTKPDAADIQTAVDAALAAKG